MSARALAASLALAAATLASAAAIELPTDPSARHPLAPSGPPVVRGGITPIVDVNRNDANGLADLGEFVTIVTIRGVAQSGVGDLDPFDVVDPSAWFYVADGTGAVADPILFFYR